jgi:peptide/nickel transport system ATP-binding protein
LIGESGSGKTTVARALVRLLRPTSGEVRFRGRDVSDLRGKHVLAYRRAVQIVFQEDEAALDPRLRVASAIDEGLRAHRLPRGRARISELLADVDLDPALARRYPHELSGGQRQRVVIARALAVEPSALILDEPTSAVDVTVQARILDVIARLRDRQGLAYLLISHNLAVVDRLCEESVVLYRGGIVERGRTRLLLNRPAHPYTQELRASVPELGRAASPPTWRRTADDAAANGCRFAHRCDLATELCRAERPALRRLPDGREVACHRVEEALAHPLKDRACAR